MGQPHAVGLGFARLGIALVRLLISPLAALGCAPAPKPPAASHAEPARAPASPRPASKPVSAPEPAPLPAQAEAPSAECDDCKDCKGTASFAEQDGTINSCCRWVGPVDCPGHLDNGLEAYCTKAEPCPARCCEPSR